MRIPSCKYRHPLLPKLSQVDSFITRTSAFNHTRVVGVTGVEPVTLRLSSACSNQLSYTPGPSSERWSVSALERDSRERSHALRFDAPTQFGGAEETRTPDL